MKSYKMVNPNYAVVTLDDGSTFGQVVVGKTAPDIEAEILAGCERVQPTPPKIPAAPPPAVGVAVTLPEKVVVPL